MKLMIPFIPHLANECLELLKSDNVNKWPKIEVGALLDVKIAVQVNGKTRDIISVKKDSIERI